MSAYLTIRLGDDAPLPLPANAAVVEWNSAPSTNDPTQANVLGYIQGDGDPTHFLNGEGQFVSAGGGGANFANLVTLPASSYVSGVNLADWTFWIRISASGLLVPNASKIKIGIMVLGGTVVIASCVIRRAAAFGTSFIDSTPVTWGGVANPSLSTAGLNLSDEISVDVDLNHDIWVLVHTDPSNTGSFSENTFGGASGWPSGWDAHRGSGDQTTTAMASLSVNADYLGVIQMVLAE